MSFSETKTFASYALSPYSFINLSFFLSGSSGRVFFKSSINFCSNFKGKRSGSGKEKLFGFFVGQVMKSSGGKANPQLTNEILKKLLKG